MKIYYLDKPMNEEEIGSIKESKIAVQETNTQRLLIKFEYLPYFPLQI